MSGDAIKVRRRTRVVEAMQVTADNLDEVSAWGAPKLSHPLPASARSYWKVGDWFVKDGNAGHMTNEQFRGNYEVVNDE